MKTLFLFFMDLGRLLCAPLLFVFRVRRMHLDGSPAHTLPKGGAVLVCNHVGFSDPMVLGCAFAPRRVCFLAAEAVMQPGLRGFLLRHAGCIRIDRNACDIEAIRSCVQVLQAGKLLCIFPQGHLQHGGALDQIKQGAAMIAQQAQVPLIPLYTDKPPSPFRRRVLIVGQAIHPQDYCFGKFPLPAELRTLADTTRTGMLRCKQAYSAYAYQKGGHS